jgi:DNA invertase Pin-like site-specific DNA recombinase
MRRCKLTRQSLKRGVFKGIVDALTPGDVVIVTRIDRLARSTFDLFDIIKPIVEPRRNSAHWRSRGPDTGTSTGRLMIAVLGGLADVERDLIRTRTAEGRNRAKRRGRHIGRADRDEFVHGRAVSRLSMSFS